MIRLRCAPLLLAAATTAIFLPCRTARADIVLSVDDPQNTGVMVFDGQLEAFAAASASPAHAAAGNGHSSIHTFGTQIAFSFEVAGNAIASTGYGPPTIDNAAIPILIQGTAGEAAGTPVIIRLVAASNAPPLPNTQLFVDQGSYAANQSYDITGYKVGDQFFFWGGLTGNGAGDYTMTATLSVLSPMAIAAPEPTTLALAVSGALGLILVARARRRY